MQYTVKTPAPGVTKKIVGVVFANGVATVDSEADRAALAYFRRAGYEITPVDEPDPEPAEPVDEQPPAPVRPREDANKPEWVAYAVALGMDAAEAEKLTKADLIGRFPEGDAK